MRHESEACSSFPAGSGGRRQAPDAPQLDVERALQPLGQIAEGLGGFAQVRVLLFELPYAGKAVLECPGCLRFDHCAPPCE